jgi:hypothetical protein
VRAISKSFSRVKAPVAAMWLYLIDADATVPEQAD